MSNKKEWFYIGRIKSVTGPHGTFQVIHFENNPQYKEDGTPNPYYKCKVKIEFADGQEIRLKSAVIKGVADHDAKRGYSNTIAFDLAGAHDYEILTMIENSSDEEQG